MIRLYCLHLLTLAALSGVATALPASCGDCDGDGSVGVLDALRAAQHSLGAAPVQSPDFEACDVSPAGGDGRISIVDALVIAQVSTGFPIPLACSIPQGLVTESFGDTSQRDDTLTSASWGIRIPGAVTAQSDVMVASPFAGASTTSTVPFRDGGARTQILLTPADLDYAGGQLQALQFVLGADEEAGRTYAGLEVLACHTTVGSLGAGFQANYAGNRPVVIRPAATEVYGQDSTGSPFDLRIVPGSFTYNGIDNLLIEIVHQGAGSLTVLQAEAGLPYNARVHSSAATDATGIATNLAYRMHAIFANGFVSTSQAVSLFLDTGSPSPVFTAGSADSVLPPGTAVDLWFQGAPDDGFGSPLAAAASAWSSEIVGTLAGYRHIRFKLVLHATPLKTPEVLRVRIPYFP